MPKLWDLLVACGALLGIVITAFGIMLRIVEVPEGMQRIGVMLGSALLLTILPPIIVGIWLRLALWEQVGVCAVCGMVVAFILRQRKGETRRPCLR